MCIVIESDNNIRPLNPNDIMREVADLFSRSNREVVIHRKYQKGIWPVEVKRSLVARILLTLFNNAGQAMPGGGDLYVETVNLIIGERRQDSFCLRPGRYVKVSVMDTGATQRVFMPFVTRHAQEGKGPGDPGLDTIYGIVRRHGGLITLERKEGIGTTFSVYLPAAENAAGVYIGPPGDPLREEATSKYP